MNATHRIRKQRWLVNATSTAQAFAIRKYLRDQWQTELLPIFEKIFNEAADEPGVIHIPKLELHLTVTSENQFIEILPDLLYQQLKKQLQPIYQTSFSSTEPTIAWQKSSRSQSEFETLLTFLHTGSIPWQMTSFTAAEIANTLQVASSQHRAQLLTYLQHQPPQPPAFYFRLLQLLPPEEVATWVHELLALISQPWKILIAQWVTALCSDSRLTRYTQWQLASLCLAESFRNRESHSMPHLEAALSPEAKTIFNECLSSLPNALQPPADQENLPPIEFEALLTSLHTGSMLASAPENTWQEIGSQYRAQLLTYLQPQPSQPPAFYFRLLQLLPQEEIVTWVPELLESILQPWKITIIQLVTKICSEPKLTRSIQWQLISIYLAESLKHREESDLPHFEHTFLSSEEQTIFNELLLSLPAAAEIAINHSSHKVSNPVYLPNQVDSNNHDAVRKTLLQSPADSLTTSYRNQPTPEIFPLTVNHAGLILLHPFISRFFENLGVEDVKTARAAALLHFLATGSEAIYEYELGLIKVLLGLQPETPLLVAPGLITPQDKSEAENLLQSAINHWPILKNTSIQGLRTAFLQRQALLRETEENWQLQVESQSFDMLLKHLPWSMSWVKLPWMTKILQIIWEPS